MDLLLEAPSVVWEAEVAAKKKRPSTAKQKATRYTLRSKYSKQPRAGKTHAWRDMKGYADMVRKYPMGHRPRKQLSTP